MSITQLTITIDNTPGRLNQVCEILEKEHINIKGIMASAVVSPPLLNAIVDSPDQACNVLQANGFTVDTREVIAIGTPDHPGGLNVVLRALKEGGVNVETLYPFITLKGDDAILIIEVDDIQAAKKVLRQQWIKTFNVEIYKT
ncbi:MAG: amino acid-binding protein [Deltaproteobacteria bacterium]|nr:amino acid-binding protein [Candidatus Anaeroferrophillus wilburensis]MBN2888342.1 amino acid-binding protein [Deltaproteobacteria bacterium]